MIKINKYNKWRRILTVIKGRVGNFFESYYELSKYGTDIKTELMAGLTTFLTMSYVLAVIP